MTSPKHLLPALFLVSTAFGHGGDGIDHTNYVSNQLPAAVADTGGGGGGSTAIQGSISPPSSGGGPIGDFTGGGGGGGGETPGGSELIDLGGPAPLAQPNTVPNGTVRDVPAKDEGSSQPLSAERSWSVEPRSNAARAWYNRGVAVEEAKMNQWFLQNAKPIGR